MRDEIVLLMRDGDKYFDHGRLSLSYLKNVVPCVGDFLTLHVEEEGLGVWRVERRYLADLTLTSNGDVAASFWVLVVEEIDENFGDHFFDLDRAVRRIHHDDFNIVWLGEPLFTSPIETAETLDRTNRDPEYWTFERKEILRKEREARLAAISENRSREKKTD